MIRIPFRKMHGIGNDFVVLDQRCDVPPIGAAAARVLADRHTGIGCDQVLVLEPPRDRRAQVFMRILNPDGGEAEACGNGTRCVACLIATALLAPALVVAADVYSAHPAQYVKDSAITAAVKTKIAAAHLANPMQVKVDTDRDGVVSLSGTAQSR